MAAEKLSSAGTYELEATMDTEGAVVERSGAWETCHGPLPPERESLGKCAGGGVSRGERVGSISLSLAKPLRAQQSKTETKEKSKMKSEIRLEGPKKGVCGNEARPHTFVVDCIEIGELQRAGRRNE